MAMKNPWAFQINYDEAIAADEAQIASINEAMANGWYVMSVTFEGKPVDLTRVLDMAMFVPGFAATLGMTTTDVADVAALAYGGDLGNNPAFLACHGDLSEKGSTGKLPFKGEMWNAFYVNGKKWLATLNSKLVFKDEDEAKKALKKAKASLARHKRNKAKFGK